MIIRTRIGNFEVGRLTPRLARLVDTIRGARRRTPSRRSRPQSDPDPIEEARP